MADKNQLKIADQVDLADDDPFAELTRIMGFDPRQPAKRPEPASVQPLSRLAPVSQPAPAAQAADEQDFSLDLEKELLGGFDLEEEQYAQPQGFPSDDASAPAFADVDFDFGDAFEPTNAPVSHEPVAIAEPDFSFDGDLDAAFAAALPDNEVRQERWQDQNGIDLDFGLTDEDIRALDAVAVAPAPQPALPVTPESVALDDFDANFYAALADIDMSFLDTPAEARATEQPTETEAETHAAPAAESSDFDINLFDEADFRLAEEANAPAAQEFVPESETFPEIGAEAFDFGLDELRLDDQAPAAEAAPQPQDETFFDDIDFGATQYEQDTAPVASASTTVEVVQPVTASNFELSVPAYVPRKLPTSPMDVAAEAFRQREAIAAPAEPEFNLEDELNALLGNKKAAPVEVPVVAQPAPVFDAPSFAPSYAAPSYSPPETYRSSTSDIFGTSGATAYQPIEAPKPEPVAFDAPAHPADIDDNLKWELDEAFASETHAAAVDQDIVYAPNYSDDYSRPYAENAGLASEAGRDYEPAYDARYDDRRPEPVDLDLMLDEFVDEPVRPEAAISYRDAVAGAAVGVAATRLGSPQVARTGVEQERFSPHRDPVVRGNPLTEDPLDIITQLAEKYSRKDTVRAATGASYGYLPEDEVDGDIDISDVFEEQPDVETVEVVDRAIALADDLDIPELPEEEDLPPAAAYDDLDAEFSSLLNDISTEPAAAQQAPAGYQDPLAGGFSARAYQARPYENAGVIATAAGTRPAPARPMDENLGQGAFSLDADDIYGRPSSGAQYADAYDYDPEFEQEIAPQQFAERSTRKSPSRGLLIAGILGGVVLVGAIGAFALSFGGGASGDAPTIVKADEGPVKVRPENPGGATVPNQENKVYDTVSGETGNGVAPQEKLVTTAEEPMDVTPPPVEEDPATASGKSEDRIEQIVQDAEGQTDAELTAVAPRKVRTMVVKPDGTLVPREDDVEMAPSNEQTEAIAAVASSETATGATGSLPESAPALAPVPEQTATVPAPVQTAGIPDAAESGATPATAPVAPLRPADQPVDVVGEVAPTQVAAATTAAATAGASWAMQIASQPSEAAAQSSYQDLVRRYGSVLQGREVNIVKAEIAGKGTFWRVRVPAPTRNEAINLCETYKAAGGNCFVSR
ncbi:MAG: SPOR domain-containing protein [Mesorhizobium sp.]|nr:SPOR domain-containing protein [Mesorhizobium sp.]MBL8576968.1 SPOR domain-containing protein [Mesorhizobium sp.]